MNLTETRVCLAVARPAIWKNVRTKRTMRIKCRAYGARILFGIVFPALPGWADVFAVGPPGLASMAIFAVPFLPQLAPGTSWGLMLEPGDSLVV
jgi:hypothetical protein